MFGVLAAFAAEDGAALEPASSSLFTDFVLTRSEGSLSTAELAAEYARAREAAAGLASVPAAHAALQLRAAEIGAQLVYRGVGPAGIAREVAAAFSAAQQGLPAGHPLAREAAARAAAFEAARPAPPAPAPREPAPPGPPAEPSLPVTADELPPVLDALGIRALAALGVGTQELAGRDRGEHRGRRRRAAGPPPP